MNALTVDQVGRSVGPHAHDRVRALAREPVRGRARARRHHRDAVLARRRASATGRHEPLAGDVDADLVIVGAGYTGLWTASASVERQPGLRVVLLEAETVGWAASGRNGGFCEASLTHGDENGRSRWPDEIDDPHPARTGEPRRHRGDRAPNGMDVDFERTGILSVAVEPHQVPWIAEPDAEDGHDVFLDESAVRAEIASPTYLAGRWDRRTNAILHPAKLVARARARHRRGGRGRARAHSRAPHRRRGLARGGRHRPWRRARRPRRARDERVPVAAQAQPAHDRARVRLRAHDRAARRRSPGPSSAGATGRASATWRTSSTTTGSAPTAASSSAATTRCTTPAVASAPSTRSGRPRSSGSRATSSPRSRSSRASGSATAGRVPSTRARASARSTAARATARWRTRRASRGSASVRRASPGTSCSTCSTGTRPSARRSRWWRTGRGRSRPSRSASMGINLTRWSLDRADHRQGRRNVLLKTLDALGLGFDS